MERLNMHTRDFASFYSEQLAQIFPECVTERVGSDGKPHKAIDIDKLKQLLSDDVIDGPTERYQFTWPEKKKAIRMANTPTNSTLRPCREDSVDFDTTENLYIEGDNLEVLKLMREDYLGRVKMIYIDPPYNTGNDFVYEDDFKQSAANYDSNSGQKDIDGNRLFLNSESNGRFHTDWLNMIYPRLKVAKDYLSEDGVIFISIDDNEQENLKKICEEIFGGRNFIAELVWQRAFSPKNDAKYVSNSHDYVLMYAKNIDQFEIGRLERTDEANARYTNPDNDPRGVWMSSDISVKTYNAECDYPITTPSGRVINPPTGRCWSLSQKAFAEKVKDNRIWFGPNGDNTPRLKRFLTDLKHDGMAPTSILFHKEVGHSQEGAQEVAALFGDKGVFDGPKPVRLMERLMTLANLYDDSIVLDFFSGSATTAHAVMKWNSENDTHYRFILVQLPEEISGKRKDKECKTICEVGKERIRRAGKKILEEQEKSGSNLFAQSEFRPKLDVGFRVLKLDSSNMQDVYYRPEESNETTLFEDNIKPDRNPEDLLFQAMLECSLPLSAKIESKKIVGKEVFSVNNGYLIACFDTDVNEAVIKEVAKMKPYYFIMRDSSLSSDNVADNIDQIFQAYSKETNRRVL